MCRSRAGSSFPLVCRGSGRYFAARHLASVTARAALSAAHHSAGFFLSDRVRVIIGWVAVDGVDVAPARSDDAVDVDTGRTLLVGEPNVDLRTADLEVDAFAGRSVILGCTRPVDVGVIQGFADGIKLGFGGFFVG